MCTMVIVISIFNFMFADPPAEKPQEKETELVEVEGRRVHGDVDEEVGGDGQTDVLGRASGASRFSKASKADRVASYIDKSEQESLQQLEALERGDASLLHPDRS